MCMYVCDTNIPRLLNSRLVTAEEALDYGG